MSNTISINISNLVMYRADVVEFMIVNSTKLMI